MTTELTAQQAFEKNIEERLRADIGNLVPDEVLINKINQTIEKMFFTPRHKTEGSGMHQRSVEIPSHFEALVSELLRERVDACIQQFMTENSERILSIIETRFENSGKQIVFEAFADLFNSRFQDMAFAIKQDLLNKMTQTY